MRKFVYWIKKAFNRNSSSIDYHRMYEHDIKKLMNYGSGLGITLDIPNDIEKKAMTICFPRDIGKSISEVNWGKP